MAVRFIIGRAGSGKTAHCLDAIRSRLREDPITGPRLILLVPEQAGLQMERAILQGGGAAHRAEVVSFRRLAQRVLEWCGAGVRRALTEPARAMVLRHLVIRHAPALEYYGQVADRTRAAGRLGGLVDRLSATISELIQEGVEPEDLTAVFTPSNSGDPAQRAKLHDLQRIYAAYLDYLGEDRLDPSRFLQVAREHLTQCPWLHGAELWVDGFASLAGQETLTLVALARLCQRVDITAMIEPRLCEPRALEHSPLLYSGLPPHGGADDPQHTTAATGGGRYTKTENALARADSAQTVGRAPPDTVSHRRAKPDLPSSERADPRAPRERLFARTYQTYRDLEKAFIEAGLEVEDSLLLSSDPPPRFTAAESLALIERTLFASDGVGSFDGSGSTKPNRAPVGVELIELPSRRIEVDYAVSRVFGWVQDPARRYRYRDVAIIVRDLEPYHDLLTEALDAHGIPFFIDRRRPITHHPLVELLRAVVAMAADDLSIESVQLALKTGLLPISTEAGDELENYLLAHGLFGCVTWRGEDWSYHSGSGLSDPQDEPTAHELSAVARVNETKRTFLGCMDAWLDFARGATSVVGKDFAAATVRLLDDLKVARSLAAWADEAERNGDLDQAEEHRQVWRDTMSFLDDLAFAFADVTLSTKERADVLETGLSGLTLGLAPPMMDQVLVGSIDRSRHPDIKTVVILGFNEGVFPRKLTEDSILNDDDRATLRSAGVRIGAPTRQRVLDEALLLYTAVTRPSEALVLTYALADNDGAALRVSPYVNALSAALGTLTPVAVGDPARQRETWDILCFGDLTERLAMEFRTRPALAEDDPGLRGLWNELYDTVRAGVWDRLSSLSFDRLESRSHTLRSLDVPPAARISPATVESVFAPAGGALRTSVSQLETYAACPFQHFAKYQLKLRERAEATLEPVDIGQVHHAILEDFVETSLSGRRGFAQLAESELLEGLRESCTRIAARLPPGGALSDARNAYLLRRSAGYLARVLRAQRKLSQAGAYRPRAAEVPFGFDGPTSLPAFELSTPAGRRVLVRGYIDRVDLAELGDELLGVVIDYKRTRDRRLDLSAVYHGLSLQLLGYLLVLAQHGESLAGRPVRPGGALYVSLAARYETVDHPDLVGDRERALPGTYRPRGIILDERFETLDDTDPAGWSSLYAMYRKKDGAFGHMDASDAADAGSFQAMLEHTRTRLGELADGILDGHVAVSPYRLGTFSPCSWCPMSSVCRFEMGLSEVRFLETLTRSEVFRRLTGGSRA